MGCGHLYTSYSASPSVLHCKQSESISWLGNSHHCGRSDNSTTLFGARQRHEPMAIATDCSPIGNRSARALRLRSSYIAIIPFVEQLCLSLHDERISDHEIISLIHCGPGRRTSHAKLRTVWARSSAMSNVRNCSHFGSVSAL